MTEPSTLDLAGPAIDVRDLFAVTSEKVGERIRRARRTKGLTMAALAKCIGRSVQAVQQWEVGQNDPGLERLLELSRHLDVDPFELITGVAAEVDRQWLAKRTAAARLGEEDGHDSFDNEIYDEDRIVAPMRMPNYLRGRRIPVLRQADLMSIDWAAKPEPVLASAHSIVTHYVCPKGCFALEIEDDSNAPQFQIGDLVVIDPSKAALPRCMILARSGEQYAFGPVSVTSHKLIEVSPLDKCWPPMSLGQSIGPLGGPALTSGPDKQILGVMIGQSINWTSKRSG